MAPEGDRSFLDADGESFAEGEDVDDRFVVFNDGKDDGVWVGRPDAMRLGVLVEEGEELGDD